MTIFTKAMTTAIIISSLGITSSAYAQDVNSPSASETPTTAWLLTIVVPQNQTSLRTDSQQLTRSTKSPKLTDWTDREPLVLAQTPEEKYVRTDLGNFSYPILGRIAYGVQPAPVEFTGFNNTYQNASVVSPSFGTNPYDRNTYRDGNSTAAQLKLRF